ncbi:uncharacterized protein LOC106065652 [Biomphalaria glabrata]|uniref:Uncharacterized protein LOC106065652 n=1 Tax=Biomphalaria glabrata TaxID=6526 RepID=A0A9W3A7H6_BIOGL|nr:uncharacterized protein LOC106065652 [Biomphalaria glabrata]
MGKMVAAEVICLLLQLLVIGFLSADEECNFARASQLEGNDKKIFYNIPMYCSAGKISWHYPQGFLYIKLFIPNDHFTICLFKRNGLIDFPVYDYSSGTRRKLNTSVQHVCTRSVDGLIEVHVEAHAHIVYMTTFNYTVNAA